GCRRLARPGDVFLVEGRVLPRGHRADVESRLAKADNAGGCVGIRRRAVKGLDQDPPRRPAQRDDALEQLVEQLVGELTHEVTLPVVPVLAVRRVEHALLVEERVRPQAVLDEAGRRAQLTELLRITVRARVARSNDENGLQRLVDPEPGLAAEIARRADREVAEAAERLANSSSGEHEAASDDTLERMQVELESRRDAEVAARAAERPEELGVLSGTRVDDGPVRSDELGADEVVAREAVLRRQVADAATECQPRNARRAHDAAWWDQ